MYKIIILYFSSISKYLRLFLTEGNMKNEINVDIEEVVSGYFFIEVEKEKPRGFVEKSWGKFKDFLINNP